MSSFCVWQELLHQQTAQRAAFSFSILNITLKNSTLILYHFINNQFILNLQKTKQKIANLKLYNL